MLWTDGSGHLLFGNESACEYESSDTGTDIIVIKFEENNNTVERMRQYDLVAHKTSRSFSDASAHAHGFDYNAR